MLNDEILFRILQASTAGAFLTLLIICMQMHEVSWWLPVPVYTLAFSCLVTFLTTFFMRAFTLDMCVVTIMALALTGLASAIHRYIQPISKNRREALNRRILYWMVPIMSVFLIIWCVGVVFDGGSAYFSRFEKKLEGLLTNQEEIIARQNKQDAKFDLQAKSDKKKDQETVEYRAKLDRELSGIKAEQSGQSLRIHRLTTDRQKSGR